MTFGEFSVDLSAGELRRNGEKVRLQDLPFRVLAALVARPGEVVTREELRTSLWDAETFVDAEAGLNTAIAKLREALDDRADAPRFIETVPKRGYRFIAAVDRPSARPSRRWMAIAALVVLLCSAGAYSIWRAAAKPTRPTIAVVLFRNETGKPDLDRLAQQLTDATVVTLAQNPAYAVIGNAAILRTPRIFQDLAAIRTSLHADYILVAQVQEPPSGLVIRAHFIRARDQVHLWAKGIVAPAAELEREVVQTIDSGIDTSLRGAPPGARLKPCPADAGPAFADAECGTVQVFENRATRQGRTIDVAFARWRAISGSASDALMLLAGGPGADGSSLAFDVHGWAATLRSAMDIVVVDQRGTGLSNSLHCDSNVETAPASSFGHLYEGAWLRNCRATLESKADLRQYTSDNSADDLDEVRAALGYAKVSLYGGSYGTRLAQVYMRRFPERVRAAVLDGVVPMDATIPLTYASTAQDALDRIAAAADVQRLLDRFASGPVATFVVPPDGPRVAVAMGRGDLGYALRGIMYGADAARILPEMIARAAATGDVQALAQRYWQRAVRFSRGFSEGLHLSVLCAEDVAFIRSDDIEPATTRTFLGRYLVDEYQRACAEWPAAGIPAEFRQPVRSAVPTLLLSGYFDPVTPPAFGERVAKSLTTARHIVSPHTAHGSVTGCAAEAALYVLRTGTIEGLPQVCR